MAAPARRDILLRPGVTAEWAIRWEQSTDGGNSFEPVAWDGWTASAELRSDTGEFWWSGPVSLEVGGLARVLVHPDALTSREWEMRGHGIWSVTATNANGRVERLGDGNFYLEG